jgi:hypothetical protein
LIVPDVVVTTTVSLTTPPCESEIVIVHWPAATEVTLKLALGPVVLAGVKVAIPVHDVAPLLAALNAPV